VFINFTMARPSRKQHSCFCNIRKNISDVAILFKRAEEGTIRNKYMNVYTLD